MKDQENHIDLIDKYLKNELSEEELLQFEGKVIEDESFGQLLNEMNTLVEGIKLSASKTTLDEKLNRLDKYAGQMDVVADGIPGKSIKQGGRIIELGTYFKRYRLPIAAVLALVITSIFTLVNISNEPAVDNLFNDYFTAYEYLGPHSNTRGSNETVTDLAMAIYYYDRKEYQQAQDHFGKILMENPDNVTALFYSGNAFLAMGAHMQAAEQFRKVINLKKGLELQSKWYLALCFLRSGDTASMKPLLQEIAENNTTYSKRANELLKALQ